MKPATKVRAISFPRWAQTLLAFGFYASFATYLTWPLVLHLDSTIYGAGGDLTGAIAYNRELVESGNLPFLPGQIDQLSAPDGLQVRWALALASLPSALSLYVLTLVFGSVAGIGLYTLAGYVATGLAMFLLVRRYAGNVWIAAGAGWAFAFYPFAALNGTGHNDFAQGWPLVILVWRMFELGERPTIRNGIYAGLGAIVAVWWSPYFILFGGVAFMALALAGLLFAAKARRFRRALGPYAVATAVLLGFVGSLAVTTTADDSSNLRTHSIEELYVYSARPHEYVIPDSHQPLLGDKTNAFLIDRMHGSNASESTLYLGVSVILLALVGLIAALRRSFPSRLRRLTFAMAMLVVVAAAFSGPPTTQIFSFTVHLPSYYIFELTSTWRVFSRLVIVVMLGMTVLAAIGSYALTRGRRAPVAAAILIAIGAVVAVDLWYRKGDPTNRLHDPPIYGELKKQPAGTVADYPLVPAPESDYNAIFQQDLHGKPVINGYREGSKEETRALQLADLSAEDTAKKLSLLGVRYVVARNGYLGGAKAPKTGPGFRLLADDAEARILLVAPKGNAGSMVAPASGFFPREPAPGSRRNHGYWTSAAHSKLDLWADCRACDGYLSMRVRSLARPRKLSVSDTSSRVVKHALVTTRQVRLRVPLRFNHRTSIAFHTDPGPQSISQATGGADAREVGVFIDSVDFRQQPRARP